jgi:carnitine-CoA ligase
VSAPARDVIDLIARACPPGDDRPALVFDDGVSITRGELRTAIASFGGYLAEHIEPGDRVAIMSENRIEFMTAWLATVAAGGMLVSINHGAREHDAGHVLADADPVLFIAGPRQREMAQRLARAHARTKLLVLEDDEPGALDRYRGSCPLDLDAIDVDPEAVTNVYYTSGTTGPPKGCMVGHDYWLRFVELYLRLYGMTATDRLLCCLQFFYGDPPWLLLTSLHAGAPLIAMRRFSVSRFWDVVRRNRVTRLFGLASIPSLLLKGAPSRADREHEVELALQIGVPTRLHRELVERWGFPWLEGYGLTETGLVVAMPREHAEGMTGSGSIGVPCPGVEIRIDGDPHGIGELQVRAPGMMRGYLGNDAATRETLRDGWLRTGDLVRIDERGFLYFLGRSKDIVRRSGENVAATEVEDVLRSHPQVNEVAVVPATDELRGEEVAAYVEPVGEAVDPGQLVEFCRERLARHKVPRYVLVCDGALPRTPSMRVKKADLRAAGVDVRNAWDRERELGW